MFMATPAPTGRRTTPGRIAYGLYAWLQFMLLGTTGVLLLLCPQSLAGRRALVRRLARLALRLAGMRLQVSGLTDLPLHCVVVANHQSYLDGVVLAALLPARFGFVIKREMARVPLAGWLLRRIGAEFVERHDQRRMLRDTRRLLRQASHGEALVFFPEGTFSSSVGLLRFHIGAFAAAARANVPVLPIAIRGTRECLAPGSFWPRPGLIQVQGLAAVGALPGQTGPGAAALREQARAALLSALGEPDLDVTEDAPLPGSARAAGEPA